MTIVIFGGNYPG